MEDFSYRLGLTGTVLNPSSSATPFVDITKISGLDTPDLRTTERDHEGVDGGFLDAEFEKMRTIVLEGQLITNGVGTEAFLDGLKYEWAVGRGVRGFYFQHPGVAERVVYVKALGVRYDVNELRRVGSCDVQFTCQAENPSIFDSSTITLSIPQGLTVTTGFGFPLGFPFGFGAPVSPAAVNALNSGNRPATAVITIPGPVDSPRIYNDTTGDVLSFGLSLAAGDSLVIDLYNRTVKLNGTASRRNTLADPNWFLLQVGDNIIRYRADSTGNPNASITYSNAWR